MPSVQLSCSDISNYLQPHGLQHSQASLSITHTWACSNSCPSSRRCHPTISSPAAPLSFCLQSFPAWVFSNEKTLCIRGPNYWSFSFSISPSNEYSGPISLRIDWLGLLAVQGALKSLLQHHSLKVPILWHSAFFIVQLSSTHDYWKNRRFDCMGLCQQSDASAF